MIIMAPVAIEPVSRFDSGTRPRKPMTNSATQRHARPLTYRRLRPMPHAMSPHAPNTPTMLIEYWPSANEYECLGETPAFWRK